jgi:cellobiose phosphorylase
MLDFPGNPIINFMNSQSLPSASLPARISSPSGLSVEMNSNGSIRRMDHGDIMLNLFLGNEAEGGLANIYLRHHGVGVESVALLGPGSPASYQVHERGMVAYGTWGDLAFRLQLVLARSAAAWFWHVELENTGTAAATYDLIHTQDLALAHYGAVRLNEYYVSQYLDHAPLEHAHHGVMVASRQNQSMGGQYPWMAIGSLGRGVKYATDALQFHGLATRAGGKPAGLIDGLPGRRLQHEHAMVCIQDECQVLAAGGISRRGFFGRFEADHPAATAAADLVLIDSALALPEAVAPEWPKTTGNARPAACLFSSAPLLAAMDLDAAETRAFFGDQARHLEQEDGQCLSFFTGERSHVVMKAKELRVLRPHGHLLRSGGTLTPDESALTSTAWMAGVFHSMVTQGHVSINRLLSTCHGYLGLFRSHGQRVFVEVDGAWNLLDTPSAYEMAADSCRWIYKHRAGLIEVVATAPADRHELGLTVSVLDGPPTRFLISHHVAINGDDGSAALPVLREADGHGEFIRAVPDSDVGRRFPDGGFRITPADGTAIETTGGDELLFADGVSRGQPYLCLVTGPALTAGVTMVGRLVASVAQPAADFWDEMGGGLQISAPKAGLLAVAADRLAEIFPWFIHNALVHYLSPRGLEQYSGGGWGTRDACQGPVELLLSLGRFAPVRDLLVRVFRQQNADGDWPQWFMFFERERDIRPGDSHGDIVYWPVLALAQYLRATGDSSLLDEPLPYFHPAGDAAAETATVWQHAQRALELMERRVVHGTHLAAYGHGDWNDSLQPVKPDMREHLCSSWTVTLNYQTFRALAEAFRCLGDAGRAQQFETMAAGILEEFQRVLVVDGVVAGLVYFHGDGTTEHLLHPRDGTTGLSYSLLPMIHAIINDMFTPRQAKSHLALIRKHLLGPDGARLFDRPLAYHGGLQTYFQRAESASYFGREIGLMYTHAHLRYCEALARFGDAEGFFHALCLANPIAIRELVATAARRQSNCYYSSSDAAFADRREAFENYAEVMRGGVALEGGWRVYSSGAGICVRLIMQCLLGLRLEQAFLVVDPVIPTELDGLVANLRLAGRRIEVLYRIAGSGCGPAKITLNGTELSFIRDPNPYRPGAARLAMDAFTGGLTDGDNRLTVWLG